MADGWYCDHCGGKNREKARFCGYCGKSIQIAQDKPLMISGEVVHERVDKIVDERVNERVTINKDERIFVVSNVVSNQPGVSAKFYKNPSTALILSILYPGLGQI